MSPRTAWYIIAIAGLVTLMAMAFIYYRSATVRAPTSAIIVEGDESLAGAEIIVTSVDQPAARATLNEENDYATPVLLTPGVYTVTITRNDRVLLRETLKLEQYRGRKYPLELLKAADTQSVTGE